MSDLSPLAGMRLTTLIGYKTPISDLSPLEKCKDLTSLGIKITKVTAAQVAALQKALPNCKIDWDDPANGQARLPRPRLPAWVKATQALPAEKQIEAVSKKLMELNPGFDGKVTGAGWERHAQDRERRGHGDWRFVTDNVTDISPVRAFNGLKALSCTGSGIGTGRLSDLSPLKELSVPNLTCGNNPITDLSPLMGTALKGLFCAGTMISDLSPLEECKSLIALRCTHTKVTAAGVAALQKALPKCYIEWDGEPRRGTHLPSSSG